MLSVIMLSVMAHYNTVRIKDLKYLIVPQRNISVHFLTIVR
jgi:hypothetical protein